MINSRISFFIFFLMLCAYSYAQDSQERQRDKLSAMQGITAGDCLKYDKYLAGEACEGRGPCSEGYDLAAKYVAEHFRKSGIKSPVEDGSYFQSFTVDRNFILEGSLFELDLCLSSSKGKDTLTIEYDLEEDFLPAGISSKCDLIAKVVFVGYGVSSADNDWDDYRKVDVEDKVVMVLGGTPPLEGADFGSWYRVNRKAKLAEENGAAALLMVGKPIGTIATKSTIPVLTISEELADEMLFGTGRNITSLKDDIKKKQKSSSFQLGNVVRFKVNSELVSDCPTMNVLGYVEGSDPLLKDEYIVIGAHVDHLGKIDKNIFYGANDNASGSAVVMDVAQAFASLKFKTKRSVLFILFTAEEMGLIGSSYFVNNSVVPVSDIKAMINLDMVGSGNDAVMVVGGRSYPEFAQIFDTISKQYIHVLIKRRWTSSNSDHYPFHAAGIPSVFLYAMRGVPTYHTSSDKPETLDPEVMERVGRLVFLTAYELANKDKIDFEYVEKE
jgi:hypothetical protein